MRSTGKKRPVMTDMMMMMKTTTTIIQYMVPNVHRDRAGAMWETDFREHVATYFDEQTIDELLIKRESLSQYHVF